MLNRKFKALSKNQYGINTYQINKRINLVKYSKENIVKALLLAPLPLLFLTALLFIIGNNEYKLSSIFVVFVAHTFIYLAYCIVTVPFSFMFSILLNRGGILNLLTICISSLIIATPFFILIGWGHTGKISEEWWKIYTNISAILASVFPGLCYWLFLINLKAKK